jgi:hypothetical protein
VKAPSAPSADDLIARVASVAATKDAPSEYALAELRKVIAHNDSVRGNYGRVRAEDACEMLAGLGWTGASRTALNTVCRKLLGRRSFGTP